MPNFAVTKVRHGNPDGSVDEYLPGQELAGIPDEVVKNLIDSGSAVSVSRAITVPPNMTRQEIEAQIAALSTQLAFMPVGSGDPNDLTVKRDQILAAASQEAASPMPPQSVDAPQPTPKGK